jgi:hypothetical protein
VELRARPRVRQRDVVQVVPPNVPQGRSIRANVGVELKGVRWS